MEEINIDKAYNLVYDKVENWIESLITMLPNILVAIIVLIAFFFVAKGVRMLSKKLLSKVSSNKGLNKLVSTILFAFIVGIGLFTALSIMQLDRALTSLLTGAGILGLALSFAFQDSASNFISGVFLALKKPLSIGDIIETEGSMGTIKEMTLRNTVLQSFQGQHIYIPNKDVYQNKFINYSSTGKRRIDLAVGVSYGDNLKLVQEKAVDAIKSQSFVIDKDEVSFVFKEFGSSSINGEIRFWIDYAKQTDFIDAQSEAIRVIKAAFDENDIMIPFPIRTLDFGIKGGQKLSPSLINSSEKTVS